MYLRIEDTDRKRSQKIYEKDIITGLKWLGIKWEGDVIRQFERRKEYRRYIDRLMEYGFAYKADGAIWLNVEAALTGKKLSIIEFDDLIRGKISFPGHKIKDFVIVASNGSPLFLLTNVIDDYLMGVTHIIRGEDHISNTPRQILLFKTLGMDLPKYAHIPLILAPDRSKMSKRAGAVSLLEYRKNGILPETLVNFLFLLGFHPKNDKEFLTLSEMAQEFDLKRVQKAGAIFDETKLLSINSWYIRNLPKDKVLDYLKEFVKVKISKQKFKKYFAITRDRMERLTDFQDRVKFLEKLPDYSSELLIFKKSTLKDTKYALNLVYIRLRKAQAGAWKREDLIKKELEQVVAENNLSNGDVFWSARVALSGLSASPQPSEIAWALGREESLERIKRAIGKIIKI
ncbi:MAG: glutamyl-tRNA synthetase [Candidatus Berkelbacteria bacterium Licking1014_7]|uniref:Glutamyl-tRNA synthetase n=1 Tax=Candidatus Berkelbacteria bacterium Licking1014_7 TaxID=2017147 RepID=A0A554LJH2_9BACT|nr:MAG: glutamyl-tRNA synthetase [Candidatus Berkelbacteria bacterium Licking1014_7]